MISLVKMWTGLSLNQLCLTFSWGVLLEKALSVMHFSESKHAQIPGRKSCSLKKSPCKFFHDVKTPLLIYFWGKSGFFSSYLLKERCRFTSTNSSEFCSNAKVNCRPSFEENWDSKPQLCHFCKHHLSWPQKRFPTHFQTSLTKSENHQGSQHKVHPTS